MNSSKPLIAAYMDAIDIVTIVQAKLSNIRLKPPFFLKNTKNLTQIKLKLVNTDETDDTKTFVCRALNLIEIGQEFIVYDQNFNFIPFYIRDVVRTAEFDRLYAYNGNDLGVTYTKQATLFKLWAPTATEVMLKLNDQQYSLNRDQFGVWSILIKEDLEGACYSYLLCINQEWREAIDPYAIAVSANSKHGVIIDLAKTKRMDHSLPPIKHATDAIIYEMHIRDFTIDRNSGIQHRGKYLGLTELHTFSKEGTVTGLSYLLELGITHVQLMPLNDFAEVDDLQPHVSYNWGYNPLFFNVPEGSYSTNPHDPYNRIIELKEMINTFHHHGLRVILDVVYNHVYIHHKSSFEKIVPGYYFRYDKNRILSDGTGVGNDFASERCMARKFIVDSIKFWIEEYHVDGFRFDLMGVLDIDTMNEIRQVAIAINPSILLYGEGWDLPTILPQHKKATIANCREMPGIGHFNDRFRDLIKGSTFTIEDRGFSLGNPVSQHELIERITGSIGFYDIDKGLFQEPSQSINYVESHDNHTFWDKVIVSNKFENNFIHRKRQQLAMAITLLSQGIPFLHSGQEFYRTKYGVENSYQAPDCINKIDWNRKNTYVNDIEYIKGLISIRKFHGAFRLPTAQLIRKHVQKLDFSNGIIGYRLYNVLKYGPAEEIIVLFNNDTMNKTIVIEGNKTWNVLCEKDKASIIPLYEFSQRELIIHSVSTIVLFQK